MVWLLYRDLYKLWRLTNFSADSTYLCKVNFDLSDIPQKEFHCVKGPKKSMFKHSKYCEANVEIRITMVATDLRFQVCFNGKEYGSSHVKIDWDSL